MTLSIEQFREQLVDYLYGELEGEPLREFEASLRASDACRRELEAMKETLRISREGVAALRALDDAPPSRVNGAVLAAALAQARELSAEPAPAAARSHTGTVAGGRAPSLWSWLRTPWLLPTLGVAAAVSIVVLHKRVESPKMPGYETASDLHSPVAEPRAAAPGAPPAGGSYDLETQPSRAARESAGPGEGQLGEAASAGPRAEGAAPSKASPQAESKRDRAPRARSAEPSVGTLGARSASGDRRAEEQADETFGARSGASAAGQGAASKGYAEPPPAWTGAVRAESAKKAASGAPAEEHAARAPSAASEEREAAPEQDKSSGSLAAKPVARARPAASEPARAVPPTSRSRADEPTAPPAAAPAPSAPADDARPGGAADPGTRAPDESVKRALEHMTARRFSQAAVAYRELLARYPKDPRAPEWRRQLTAAMQALSNVDSIR